MPPKVLNAQEYVTLTITDEETIRFEAFLDRNYPEWRKREISGDKHADTIERQWWVGQDEIERTALYRKQYVEICDNAYDMEEGEAVIHFLKHRICDINGDNTPIAVWAK